MLFNRNSEMTFTEIKDATNIPEAELKESLKYMCNPKQKIVQKENAKTPEFTPQEKCKIFLEFQSPNVKVNFIPANVDKPDPNKAGPGGAASGANQLSEERKNIMDAVIVRIMKARKTEKQNQLIEDVMKQVNMFLPQPQWIKMRIESLIERDYMKRDDADRTKFIYLP